VQKILYMFNRLTSHARIVISHREKRFL